MKKFFKNTELYELLFAAYKETKFELPKLLSGFEGLEREKDDYLVTVEQLGLKTVNLQALKVFLERYQEYKTFKLLQRMYEADSQSYFPVLLSQLEDVAKQLQYRIGLWQNYIGPKVDISFTANLGRTVQATQEQYGATYKLSRSVLSEFALPLLPSELYLHEDLVSVFDRLGILHNYHRQLVHQALVIGPKDLFSQDLYDEGGVWLLPYAENSLLKRLENEAFDLTNISAVLDKLDEYHAQKLLEEVYHVEDADLSRYYLKKLVRIGNFVTEEINFSNIRQWAEKLNLIKGLPLLLDGVTIEQYLFDSMNFRKAIRNLSEEEVLGILDSMPEFLPLKPDGSVLSSRSVFQRRADPGFAFQCGNVVFIAAVFE